MISILIPLYNGIEFLDECISSVIAQTYTNWEILIGVNGLTSKEHNIIHDKVKQFNDKRIKIKFLPKIKGKCETLNVLSRSAKHGIICLLDVDDKWLPQKLEKQLPFIEKYDVVGSDAEYFGDKIGTPGIFLGELTSHMFYYQNPVINSSAMMKRRCAGWDRRWEGLDDYQLWIHLLNNGKSFYNVSEVLINHRIHGNSYFNGKNNVPLVKFLNRLPKLNGEEVAKVAGIMHNKKWKL